MNKSEKLISLVLGAILVWYIFGSSSSAPKGGETAAVTTNAVAQVVAPAPEPATSEVEQVAPEQESAPAAPVLPAEEFVRLENDEVEVLTSTHGAVVKGVTLKKFATNCGPITDENGPVIISYSDEAAMGLAEGQLEAFQILTNDAKAVTFVAGAKKRTISIEEGYKIVMKDEGIGGAMSIGRIEMGDEKDDILSVDSCAAATGKIMHHGDESDSKLYGYLRGGSLGGCGCSSAPGDIKAEPVTIEGDQKFVALKNRFFVNALVGSTAVNSGFVTTVVPKKDAPTYRPDYLKTTVKFEEKTDPRTTTFFVGPKSQSLLADNDMRGVMEFGMWSFLCYPIVWLLNLFYAIIPNYGIAIILLTVFVRLIFWPLTRKSTVGMKKMQEIQPLVKEIQAKYKDNPQRMQQEMWQLYREKQVNPLSSCLPMLIQIPIFIALFNVLRSAVELRYASFLWISDLSAPENLFGWLNILPILMAVTTGLQSYFTPSAAGQEQQQKMMMIFMPVMMLVMFYSFPSALSLYWFLSNVFSIVQMWLIRRQSTPKKEYHMPDQIIDPPKTRQMRRHA